MRSDAQFPDLLEILPAPVAWISADGTLSRLNRAFEAWCGVSRTECLDRPCREALAAVIGSTAAQEWNARLETALLGEPVQFDSRVVRSSGSCHLRVSFTPDRDDCGRIRAIVVLLQDTMEMRHFEDRRLPEDTGFCTVSEDGDLKPPACAVIQAPDGMSGLSTGEFPSHEEVALQTMALGVSISRYDPEGDFPLVYVNPAFEKITGYRRSEILGRNCRFLQGPGTESAALARIQRAVERGHPIRVTIQTYRKCGTPFIHELSLSPVRDPDGRITHVVGIHNDITARILVDGRLAFEAQYDPVTGIANRYLFLGLLRQALRPLRGKGGRELAVVHVNIDNFKQVNDVFGQHGGDRVLRQFAQRIRSVIRKGDVIARTGADEFVVLACEFGLRANIEKLIDRILRKVSFPVRIGGRELVVTASAGYAVAPGDAMSCDDLLRKANLAMDAAKRERRNAWKAWHSSMEAGNCQILDISSELRRALKRNEFVLMYQPRIDAASGCLQSLEALIRWQHPARGIVPPGEFIPIAEETGLIAEIGEWVLQESLRQIAFWRSQGYENVPVSINVSAAQFRNPAFPGIVAQALRDQNVPPELLEIELTESIFMDESVSKDVLPALREIGVRVAIDDFGTGYSGLGYLSRFSVDTLKIDRCFTSAIGESATHSSICRSILQLAQELRLTTVAEGVETAEQAGLLRDWGCDQLQGFHFSHPVHAAVVADMLRASAVSPTA